MNKENLLAKYKKQEDKLLVAKLLDKIAIAEKQNKITYTNFLDPYQKKVIENLIKEIKIKNGMFFGGYETAERTIHIFYPEKLQDISIGNLSKDILGVVSIQLPKESYGKYVHKDYLGALMKIGLQREKIGDILVEEKRSRYYCNKRHIKLCKRNIKPA